MIKGLHHNAYRCRDSEQTRQFYEDFQPVSEERVRELLAAAQPSVEQPA